MSDMYIKNQEKQTAFLDVINFIFFAQNVGKNIKPQK
jgi:hypothetical protein